MWISNTATTLVMLPIAVSVIDLLRNDGDGFTNGDRNFALSIMLGIAYSANIGGVAALMARRPIWSWRVSSTSNTRLHLLLPMDDAGHSVRHYHDGHTLCGHGEVDVSESSWS